MKNKPAVVCVLTVLTAVMGASCARNEAPVAEAAPPAASAPEPAAPVSAFRAAPAAVKPSPTTTAKKSASAVAPASSPASTPAAAPAPVAKAPAPMTVTLAEGTVLPVRIGSTLTSENSNSGDSWSGTLSAPVVINGLVIAETGANVGGRVSDVKRAGRVKGVGTITLTLNQIVTADGQRVAVNTSSFTAKGKDETKKDVGKVAIVSGIGAAIGAIAGGGKGAAIGAGAGAGAGTGVVLATRGGPATIATEALVNFRVTTPVTITEKAK